jgi:hypothetical protein
MLLGGRFMFVLGRGNDFYVLRVKKQAEIRGEAVKKAALNVEKRTIHIGNR